VRTARDGGAARAGTQFAQAAAWPRKLRASARLCTRPIVEDRNQGRDGAPKSGRGFGRFWEKRIRDLAAPDSFFSGLASRDWAYHLNWVLVRQVVAAKR
jgi:hypothetical protein